MSTDAKDRSEAAIFADLKGLCTSPGFPEAVAQICARANLVRFNDGGLTGEALSKLYDPRRLIRTEISVLVGLLARGPLDESVPTSAEVEDYISRAEALFAELHDALSEPWKASLREVVAGRKADDALGAGASLREPFFYSGESAFSHQYRDFAVDRYAADDAWLKVNRRFSIYFARDVVKAIGRLQLKKVLDALHVRRGDIDEPHSLLQAHAFSAAELADFLRTSVERVEPVLTAFLTPPDHGNETFEGIQHFNATNAAPLLRLSNNRYVLFQIYSLAEALYESPAFWMMRDRDYRALADKHRGAFPEQFARKCLEGVFGKSAVHLNVELPGSRKGRRGEIDVLVVYGDHAIVLQAKSKRLTIEARRGSDGAIRKDFQAAIQDACNQARDCANALLSGSRLRSMDGRDLALPKIRHVYPLCLVADHYPALAAQVRRFLDWDPIDGVAMPLVTDVFTLDALTEMLGSPLRVVNYLSLRERFIDRVNFNHELVLLGFHLKQNIWVEDGIDGVYLDDSFSADLDAAMVVRRDGAPGPRLPPGILTRSQGTSLTRLVEQIETNPAAVELGLLLLQLGEKTHVELSHAIDHMCARSRQDGRAHDFSAGLQENGLTFHINDLPDRTARERLEAHCTLKKYQQRAETWNGVLLHPRRGDVRAAIRLEAPWEFDSELEDAAGWLQQKPQPPSTLSRLRLEKPRRNAPCPCGSGRKYKKCCRA